MRTLQEIRVSNHVVRWLCFFVVDVSGSYSVRLQWNQWNDEQMQNSAPRVTQRVFSIKPTVNQMQTVPRTCFTVWCVVVPVLSWDTYAKVMRRVEVRGSGYMTTQLRASERVAGAQTLCCCDSVLDISAACVEQKQDSAVQCCLVCHHGDEPAEQ